MSTKRVQRNLTIMFTDISGFTRHTEKITRDKLMDRLDTHNKLLMPIVAHFEGNIVKSIGDSFMITFESPTNAVECGTFMQHTLRKFNADKPEAEQIHIKVSINAGEVTVTENDIFGDAVNVASKIEKVTSPDEIYFTESVFLSMNKAEVPNAFVKSFRPKGADSQEIKLYKVVQDENEPSYKRLVTDTHIDTQKMKTRVIELSKLAEKEYARYQDALEQLVTQHGRTSRTGLIATVAAALIVGVAILVGFLLTRPDPVKQLENDVRAFLVSDKPKDARTVVEAFVKQHGETDAAKNMRAEIRSFELNALEKDAAALLAQGQAEIARTRIKDSLGGDQPTPGVERVLKQAEACVEAQALLDKGEYAAARARVAETFGEVNPGDYVRRLREQASALADATALLGGENAEETAGQAMGILTKAFDHQSSNPAYLKLITKALTHDLCRMARKESGAKARERADQLKKQFVRVTAWNEIEREIDLAGLHFALVDHKYWLDLKNHMGAADETVWRIRNTAKERKDSEMLWRLGDAIHKIYIAKWQHTDRAFYDMWLATEMDADVPKRHPEFKEYLSKYLGNMQAVEARDPEDPENKDYWPVREYVSRFYYKDLRDRLIKGLTANSGNRPAVYERINCFCILSDNGEPEHQTERLEFLKMALVPLFEKQQIYARHFKPLLALDMTYEEYEEYRAILDRAREDGAFSSYKYRHSVLDEMTSHLKEAQPVHTARYGK